MLLHRIVDCIHAPKNKNEQEDHEPYLPDKVFHWVCHFSSTALSAIGALWLIRSRVDMPYKVLGVLLTLLATPTLAEDSEEQVADFIDYTEAQALGETGFDQPITTPN